MRFFILDISGFAHRLYWTLPQMRINGEERGMLFGLAKTILDLVRNEQPEFLVACLDAPGKKWRHDKMPEYKAQRDPPPPGLKAQLSSIQTLLVQLGIPAACAHGFEADDIIAEICSDYRYDSVKKIIVSSDKDLMQLVRDNVTQLDPATGRVYDREAVKDKFGVYPEQLSDYLAIVGDASDNIKGVPGLGKSAALRILSGSATKKEQETMLANVESLAMAQMLVTLPMMPNVPAPTLKDCVCNLPPVDDLKKTLRTWGFESLAREAEQMDEVTL